MHFVDGIGETFLEWEEEINFFHAMHSEWVYMKGVQDGLELLTVRYLKDEEQRV